MEIRRLHNCENCSLSVGFLCRGAGAKPLHPPDRPAVPRAALSASGRTGRCKKVYGSYRKISLIHKGFLDCKPSCATARVRGLSPLRHRPPFALREGGFAPFTPAIEETQQPAKLQFISSRGRYGAHPRSYPQRRRRSRSRRRRSAPCIRRTCWSWRRCCRRPTRRSPAPR